MGRRLRSRAYILAALAGVLFVVSPAYAAALTPAEINSVIAVLQSFGVASSTIDNVRASLAGGPTAATTTPTIASSTCYTFTRDLELHDSGADVEALQSFLNAHGSPIAPTGPGSAGQETDYFGSATYAALARFQAAHGITPASGYFGPLTRAAVASLCTAPVLPATPSIATTTATTTPTTTATSTAVVASSTPSYISTYISEPGGLGAVSTISSIATSSVTQSSAAITWTTDEPATSEINYGTTTSYGSASSSPALTTSHAITLTGLTGGATYHFEVESADGQGHTVISSDRTFFSMYPLTNWDAAKLAVSGGTRNAKLLFYGESTTAGAYADGSNVWTGALALSYPVDTAASLPGAATSTYTGTQGVPAGQQNIYDPQFTSSASNWNIGGNGEEIGYASLFNFTNTDPLSFVPTTPFDTLDLYYESKSILGSYTVDIDGESTTTINQDTSTDKLNEVKISTTLGTHTIDFTRSSGYAGILSFATYNSAQKQITTFVAGWSGGVAANLSSTANGPQDSLNALQFIAPDLTILMIGNNDMNASTSISTFTTDVQNIITAAKASGDIILVTDAPIAASNIGGQAPLAEQQEYVNALISLAQSNGVNLVNLYQLWGSYTQANANGWMANTVHPNAAGYAQIANAVLPYVLH
jgi:lysophospholipase L1-like esterase